MADTSLSGLTPDQAKEFHEHWKHGVWSWVMTQNPRCMPRCGLPRKSNRNSIVANDDNYALAA
jgi:hypothetical protein